jgi:hypothetical protein
MPDTPALLFVHNIDSGVLSALHDYSSSKVPASATGACPLSTLTHSPVGIKKEWKRFLKDLRLPSRTLDRNEFLAEFGQRPFTFPVVVLKKGVELSVFISTAELSLCNDLGALIRLVKERLTVV